MKPAVLLLLATSSVFAQTGAQTAAPKPATTHPATTAKKTATTPAIPGVPRVAGIPKVLYALKYIDVVVGKGELAVPRKWYTVNYTGYLSTGKKFDSSFDHTPPGPITFPYGARKVIAGWDTGFEGMHVGGKRRLFIPYQLAYGEAGNPVIPAKSTLVFDVELLGFSDTPPPQPAPPAGSVPPPPAKPATPPPSTTTPTPTPATPPPATAPATTTTPPPTR